MRNQTGADAELMNTLRNLPGRLDPIPGQLAADATAAYSRRTADKELAALTSDSLLDDRSGAVTPGDVRHLTFVGRSLCVKIDVGANGLQGRLVPAAPGDVELRWSGGSTTTVADERGGFSMPTVPTGPVSLRCQREPASSSPVVTDWVTL